MTKVLPLLSCQADIQWWEYLNESLNIWSCPWQLTCQLFWSQCPQVPSELCLFFSSIQLSWTGQKLRFHENFVKQDRLREIALMIILYSYVTLGGKPQLSIEELCICVWVSVPVMRLVRTQAHVPSAEWGIQGLASFWYRGVFFLSACPCVLRYTCDFCMGVPVLSVKGFLCTCGTA